MIIKTRVTPTAIIRPIARPMLTAAVGEAAGFVAGPAVAEGVNVGRMGTIEGNTQFESEMEEPEIIHPVQHRPHIVSATYNCVGPLKYKYRTQLYHIHLYIPQAGGAVQLVWL